jgi:hypothetical protein
MTFIKKDYDGCVWVAFIHQCGHSTPLLFSADHIAKQHQEDIENSPCWRCENGLKVNQETLDRDELRVS